MRVFELAKKHGMTSKDLVRLLGEMGIIVKNHMGALQEHEVEQIDRRLQPKAAPASKGDPLGDKKRARVLIKRRAVEPSIPEDKPAPTPPAAAKPEHTLETLFKKPSPPAEPPPPVEKVEPAPTLPESFIAAGLTPGLIQSPPSTVEAHPPKPPLMEVSKAGLPAKPKEKFKKGGRKTRFGEGQSPRDSSRWGQVRPLPKREDRYHRRREAEAAVLEITKPRRKVVKLEPGMTVKDFAETIGMKATEVMAKLIGMGIMATINQPIDMDAATLLAENFGIKTEIEEQRTIEDMIEVQPDEEGELLPRPPVVTIMGHVDHGKTSLLDAVRETRVTESESGGITQHIGAYMVSVGERRVSFLDTPGHEAFTAMRARGAQATDIVVLVVAADDGVMPQTVEAINHAKAAGVPIIVAINKIDKPEANPERVKQTLTEHGLVPESWGGETIFVEVSAKKKIGLDALLEMILLQADVLELKANPGKLARGVIIEAKIDRGRGPVATVLVQEGTLRVGDAFVTGTQFGKVRALNNDRGGRAEEAGPSTPVEVIGLDGVPQAGDSFVAVKDEAVSKEVAQVRAQRQRSAELANYRRVTLDDLYSQIKEGTVKELNVVVKADVQGSVEAILDALNKLAGSGVKVRSIHSGAGGITESDVLLASASNAIILGFHVRPETKAKALAERENVDIRLYTVIYDAIADVKAAMEGLLEPTLKERSLGRAEVRRLFQVPKAGVIAGCTVTDGTVTRASAGARIIRDNVVVYEGKLSSLRRFKDDVREVATGFECGIGIENYNDLKVGDVIEVYAVDKIAAKL